MTGNQTIFTTNYTILIVDDDEANLVVMEATLGAEFNLVTARSGQEALSIIERQPIAVVLTDQRMPGMTGVDLCAILLQRYPDIRRLLVTAYSDVKSAIDAINRGGVEHYIQKPWSTPQLAQILRESLARVHLEKMVHTLRAELLHQQRLAAIADARALALHDLGNIHQPIFIAVDSLKALLAPITPFLPVAIASDLLHEIQALSESTQLLHKIHNSASARASAQMPPESVAADEVLTLVERLLRGDVLRPEIQIRMVCASDSWLFVHRTDIARILINLVRNAIQAIERAGVSEGVVELRVTDHGDCTRITVSDNGPGIPTELRDRVFEAWASSRHKTGGSGLGLYIARELVTANGGEISFECPPDGGTAFHLTLPSRAPGRGALEH